jgi:hypothetical protein
MQTLTILASSPESARGMIEALSEFRAELVDEGERCEVVVQLGGSDGEIVQALNALERYVTNRGAGPARIELDGRDYTLHPVA